MPIAPIHLSTLVDSLVLAGRDGAEAARLAGVLPAQMDPSADWLDEAVLDRLMCAVMTVTGDPGWGFEVSTSLALARYGPQAIVIGQAPTLRHALRDMLTFAPLIMDRPEVTVDEQAGVAVMQVNPLATTPEGRRFRTELLMSLTVHQSRRAGGRSQDLIEVCFAHAEPTDAAHRARYAEVFGDRLSFGQPGSGITFPASLLDAPLAGHDRSMYEVLRAQVQALMDQRMRDQDVLHATRQALRQALPRVPEAAELARALGCSERSLRRQLALKGLTYAELVQACQREAAERLLRDGRSSLKQIADLTGFSSASCFHRAFRRWHGMTPKDWQDGLRP